MEIEKDRPADSGTKKPGAATIGFAEPEQGSNWHRFAPLGPAVSLRRFRQQAAESYTGMEANEYARVPHLAPEQA